MCGKFTAMYSWRQVHDFSQPLTTTDRYANDDDGAPKAPANDEIVTYRPVDLLPVIVWDKAAGARKTVPMRWGFPHRSNVNRPDPIHARSESVDQKAAFKDAFLAGQRGIVVFRTFNEGEETTTSTGKPKTIQWTIDPQDGVPRGFAFIWRRFEVGGEPPFLAAVMCTVPANELIRREIMANQTDPRMPAILQDADWATWLGETASTPEQAKAVLKTMEGVTWKVARETGPKAPRAPVPDRNDLF
ncbi:MAG TPA: SOS response-associated peptidase family protein [Rhizomicrobium sp.]|jgi:putative SOS response-associated peptidase YedK